MKRHLSLYELMSKVQSVSLFSLEVFFFFLSLETRKIYFIGLLTYLFLLIHILFLVLKV